MNACKGRGRTIPSGQNREIILAPLQKRGYLSNKLCTNRLEVKILVKPPYPLFSGFPGRGSSMTRKATGKQGLARSDCSSLSGRWEAKEEFLKA